MVLLIWLGVWLGSVLRAGRGLVRVLRVLKRRLGAVVFVGCHIVLSWMLRFADEALGPRSLAGLLLRPRAHDIMSHCRGTRAHVTDE